MKNKYILIGLILVVVPLVSACVPPTDITTVDINGENNNEIEALNQQIEQLNSGINQLTAVNKELKEQNDKIPPASPESLWDIGHHVIQLIKDKNMIELSNYVHSTKGIRFSPYYIDIPKDQVFTAEELAALPEDSKEYHWGYYIGTLVPTDIVLDFNDYYEEFIYDDDYMNASMIGVNAIVSYGTARDGISDQFPNAEYLEFYIQHSPHYEGTHWKRLILAFEEENGQYKLMAIVHGEWHDIYNFE